MPETNSSQDRDHAGERPIHAAVGDADSMLHVTRSKIHEIHWQELFPWLILGRAVRLAMSLPLLVLATVGTLLMPCGWWAAESLLQGPDDVAGIASEVEANHAWPVPNWVGPAGPQAPRTVRTTGRQSDAQHPYLWMRGAASAAVEPVQRLVRPAMHLFQFNTNLRQGLYFLLGTLWNLAVWSLLGGAIARMAVMQLGRQEREGAVAACRFAGRRFASLWAAPMFPLFGVLVAVVAALLIGLLMRLDFGMLVASLLWALVLVAGLVIAVILVGLLLGWPLMWGALATEEMGDVFEASQRCYGYTFGRPVHYLFYAMVAVALGGAGYVVINWLADLVLYFSYWAVSWGSGVAALQRLNGGADGVVAAAAFFVQLGNSMVLAVAGAYRYSFFWSAAGVIYLLLRRVNDGTELDEVYLGPDRPEGRLPDLTRDDRGVPDVAPSDEAADQ